MTHIYISKLTIIGSDKGLAPEWRQAITWTSIGVLLIWALGANFKEIWIKIHAFSFKKIHFKMLSGKCQLWLKKWLDMNQATSHYLNQCSSFIHNSIWQTTLLGHKELIHICASFFLTYTRFFPNSCLMNNVTVIEWCVLQHCWFDLGWVRMTLKSLFGLWTMVDRSQTGDIYHNQQFECHGLTSIHQLITHCA